MKLNFCKQILSVAVLTVAFSGFANAQSGTILFTTDTDATNTTVGEAIQGMPIGPITGIETGIAGLTLDIGSATAATDATLDPAVFQAVGTRSGIMSGNDATSASFSNGENLTFSFNQGIFIESSFFGSLGASDTANFNGIALNDTNTAAGDIAIFTPGGNFEAFATGPEGLFLAAGDSFTFSAGDGTVGLRNLVVTVAAVPEPSSAALLGLLSLGVVARRRRR